MTILVFADASAMTASWAISPKYDKLSRYYSDIFVFQQNGKWGMVKTGDVEILPASYEFITPFVNGYALAGVKEGNQYLLQAIITEVGNVSVLNDKVYLPSSNQYFSEGKLVVSNSNGKFGYINPHGQVIIKLQFDKALPFREGWAPVKQGNYFKYINDTYDINPSRSILVVDFHYGEMTLASCFLNGRAAIAYNKDFALIGANGQKVKKLNETEFKQTYKNNNSVPKSAEVFSKSKNYSEYSENGLYGLKFGNDVIVKPQFNSFPEQFSDGYIIADKNNRQGVLIVTKGSNVIDINAQSGPSSGLAVDRNGNNDGVVVAETSNNSTLSHPNKLRVSQPIAVSSKADENDNVTIYSTIFNDSNKEVSVKATLTAIQSVSYTYTIPAHGNVRISLNERITSSQNITATILLSTGEKASNTIYFEKFLNSH